MMIDIEDEDIEAFLEHYGVKGMRWGVRKGASGSSANAERRSKKKEAKAVKAKTKAKAKAKAKAQGKSVRTKEIHDARRKQGAGIQAARAAMKAGDKAGAKKIAMKTLSQDTHAAAKLTKGEHAAAFIAAGPAGNIALRAITGSQARAYQTELESYTK